MERLAPKGFYRANDAKDDCDDLNRNHNRVVKDVFKGAATAAATRPGALQDWYEGMLRRGMREELARVTLARKLAALTLRLWKHGGRYDATQLSVQAR